MKLKKSLYILSGLLVSGIIGAWTFKNYNLNSDLTIGQEIDNLNGVAVYFNGGVNNITGRNTTKDGYNLGLKYQCVEFVKRYYYQHLNHKMPDSYGNAKDFYNASLADGQLSPSRNLNQYTNPSILMPQVDDLLIFKGTLINRFGHVAIISKVSSNEIEIIQQNPGPFEKSRETFSLENKNGKWEIQDDKILGWLRKNEKE